MNRFLIFIFVILLSPTASSQAWQWEWARSVGSNIQSYSMPDDMVGFADLNNNIYRVISYEDSICFPGVTLTPPDQTTINIAVAIYNEDGIFLRAFDLHYHWGSDELPEVVVDNDANIYLAGHFHFEVQVKDSLIYAKTGNDQSYEQVFVTKLDQNLNVKWIKLIYSRNRTVLNGLCMTKDENLVVATDQSSFLHQLNTAYFLGQDSTTFTGGLISILKVSKEGKLHWRKEIKNPEEGQSGKNIFWGLDGFIHFCGYTRDSVIIEGDTLVRPPDYSRDHSCLYFIAMNENGAFLNQRLLSWDLTIWDLKVSKSGNVYFTGEIQDTLFFGKDTIIRPEPIHDYQIVGCVSEDFEPIWYHTTTTHASNKVSLNLIEDTLLYTTQCRHLLNIAGQTFSIGEMEAFTGFFTPEGKLAKTLLTQCDIELMLSSAILDNHKNLLLAGYFQFEAYFGPDTLRSDFSPDFFLAKFRMYCPPAINLGNYTAIQKNDSLNLNAGPGYDHYHWSTGDSTDAITIHGSDFEAGTYTISVEATEGPCTGRDSITFTILNNPGICEKEPLYPNIYPNPSTGIFMVDLSEPECTVSLLNSGGMILPESHVRETGPGKIRIDLTDQPGGIYFLKLQSSAGARTIKLVKL
jgi:hypothetical protein